MQGAPEEEPGSIDGVILPYIDAGAVLGTLSKVPDLNSCRPSQQGTTASARLRGRAPQWQTPQASTQLPPQSWP